MGDSISKWDQIKDLIINGDGSLPDARKLNKLINEHESEKKTAKPKLFSRRSKGFISQRSINKLDEHNADD